MEPNRVSLTSGRQPDDDYRGDSLAEFDDEAPEPKTLATDDVSTEVEALNDTDKQFSFDEDGDQIMEDCDRVPPEPPVPITGVEQARFEEPPRNAGVEQERYNLFLLIVHLGATNKHLDSPFVEPLMHWEKVQH